MSSASCELDGSPLIAAARSAHEPAVRRHEAVAAFLKSAGARD